MFIAVDIGNSRIKFGLFTKRPEFILAPPTPDAVFSSFRELETAIRQHFGGENPGNIEWHVSSVNHRNLARFENHLKQFRAVENLARADDADDIIKIITPGDIAMELSPEPQTLGVDRILAAYAAWKIFGHGPLMVADFGTATTLDMVSESGRFEGGAIFPGLQTAANSLREATEALPLLDMAEGDFPAYPGRNTRDAILCGIFGAAIGTVKFYLEMAEKKRGKPIPLIIGGGNAEIGRQLKNFIDSPIHLEPNLVIRGIVARN